MDCSGRSIAVGRGEDAVVIRRTLRVGARIGFISGSEVTISSRNGSLVCADRFLRGSGGYRTLPWGPTRAACLP